MKNDVETIQAFLEGALTPDETSVLHARLADEPGLQQELHAQMQLFALEAEAGAGSRWGARKGSEGGARGRVTKRSPVLWPLAGMLAAASIGFLIVRPLLSHPQASVWGLEPSRQHAFRVALPEASGFRPYVVQRSGGAAAEPLTLKLLSDLESRAQWHALGVAQLLRGNVKDARQALARAPQTADVFADVAAAALADNAPLDAIRAASQCLELDKTSAVCQWNLGLALEAQGLVVGARTAFEKVAALKESGWAEEAASRAKALQGLDYKALYLKGRTFAAEWVLADMLPPKDFWKDTPGLARLAAHVVVAASTNADSVNLAQGMLTEMDSSISKEWIQSGARHDASQVDGFRRLYFSMLPDDVKKAIDAHGVAVLSAAEKEAFFKQVLKTGNGYQQATALLLGYGIVKYQAAYDAAMKGQADSWYGCGVLHQQGQAAFVSGRHSDAETTLRNALVSCGGHQYRMAQIEALLGRTLLKSGQLVAASQFATSAWKRARELGQQDFELYAIENLAEVARKEEDLSVAASYYGELVLAKPGNCFEQIRKSESLASMHLNQLHFAEAERLLEEASCGEPTILGVSVLADLVRVRPRQGDRVRLSSLLEANRQKTSSSSELKWHFEAYEAIAHLSETRSDAIADLEGLVRRAKDVADSSQTAFATSLALRYLALEAGESSQWDGVFSAVARMNGLPVPRRCSVAVESHLERTVFATVDSNGALRGRLIRHHQVPVRFQFSNDLVEALIGCATVSVLSGQQTYGDAGLLPSNLAWFFASQRTQRQAVPGGDRLVVRNTEPPSFLHLARLTDAAPLGADVLALEGPRATVSSVMNKLPDAKWVEFHTHGLVDASIAEASHLILSARVDAPQEAYALTVEMVRSLVLKHAPTVFLAACHSAVASSQHRIESFTLPAAFLKAGARAVVAATTEIPDARAKSVFASLRQRLESNPSVATALRDERESNKGLESAAWIDQLVVYEEVE